MQTLEELAQRSVQGDRAAVTQLVIALKDDLFGVALRMLGHPADAEDATQEVLVKIITHLGTYRGDSSVRTWAWRIAVHHLLRAKQSTREALVSGFESIDYFMDQGRDAEAVTMPEADAAVLAEEVKLGCLHAILLALDRDERMAYTLGEVYGLTGEQAAEVLEIDSSTFRKRLSRARAALAEYMGRRCGLVADAADCRCKRQIPVHLKHDFIRPENLVFSARRTLPRDAARAMPIDVVESFARSEKIAETFRGETEYSAPDAVVERIRALLSQGHFDFLS